MFNFCKHRHIVFFNITFTGQPYALITHRYNSLGVIGIFLSPWFHFLAYATANRHISSVFQVWPDLLDIRTAYDKLQKFRNPTQQIFIFHS